MITILSVPGGDNNSITFDHLIIDIYRYVDNEDGNDNHIVTYKGTNELIVMITWW